MFIFHQSCFCYFNKEKKQKISAALRINKLCHLTFLNVEVDNTVIIVIPNA